MWWRGTALYGASETGDYRGASPDTIAARAPAERDTRIGVKRDGRISLCCFSIQ